MELKPHFPYRLAKRAGDNSSYGEIAGRFCTYLGMVTAHGGQWAKVKVDPCALSFPAFPGGEYLVRAHNLLPV